MRLPDLLKCFLDVEQTVEVESCLESTYTTRGEGGGASTLGTADGELSLLIRDD